MRVQRCPSCGAPLAPAAARCESCRALVRAEPSAPAPSRGLRFAERVEGDSYVATIGWEPLLGVAVGVFLVAAAVPVVFASLFWSVSPAVAALAALAPATMYVALVRLTNGGVLRIGERVTFRSGPLLFGPSLDVPLADVDGFEPVVFGSRNGARYRIEIKLARGRTRIFPSGARSDDGVRYVAESLETALRRAHKAALVSPSRRPR